MPCATALHHGGRCGRIEAVARQPFREQRHCMDAHIHRQCRAWTCERREVQVERAILGVAGHERDGSALVPMRQRDRSVGGTGERCGDARHDLERDAGGGQRFRLLAASTKDQRIATLQPYDAFAFARQPNQQRVDPVL